MVILVVSICFTCCLVFPCGASSEADTDYYWKDYYNGQVPSDAIPGGYDKNGKTTYIALMTHPTEGGFLPGNLYPGLYAITQPDSVLPVYTNSIIVKVLCSRHHKRYKWAKITNGDFTKLNEMLVRGGYSYSEFLYIGRAILDGEMKVGKVATRNGLWLPHGKTWKYYASFEILVYKGPCSLCWDD